MSMPAARTTTPWAGSLLLSLALITALSGDFSVYAQTPTPELSPAPGELVILSPEPGAVLMMDQPVEVRARLGGVDLADLDSIDVRVTIRAPDRNLEIDAGDVRLVDATDLVGMTWDPAGMPPGRIELTLVVTAGELEALGSTVFTLRRRPSVEVRLVDLQLIDTGVEARFEARAATGDDVPVTSYAWTAAEGRETELTREPTFTAVYPDLGSDYSLAVEVADAMGAATLEHYLLSLPEDRGLIAAKLAACRGSELLDRCLQFFVSSEGRGATCGCESMTVRSIPGDFTGIYCLAPGQPLMPSHCTRVTDPKLVQQANCQGGKMPIRCPLNVSAPSLPTPVPGVLQLVKPELSFGFEVVAKLTQGSTASACTEGQYVRSSSFANDVKDLPGRVNLALPQPPSGVQSLPLDEAGRKSFTFFVQEGRLGIPEYKDPKTAISRIYGLDNYAGDDSASKRDRANAITWRDLPGVNLYRNPPNGGGKVLMKGRYQADFIAFVRGGTRKETCWCQFTVDVSYQPPQPGAPAKSAGKLEKIRGYRCTVPKLN